MLTNHQARTGFHMVRLLLVILVLVVSRDAWTLTISPSPSSTGNYTITWQPGCYPTGYTYPYPDYICRYLYENGTYLAQTSPLNITGKPPGTYHYDVMEDWWYYQTPVESADVLVGTPPPRDPIPTQLTYQYQTRAGDINSDGKTDLFVKRTSGGVSGNGVLESIILLQYASGSGFSLLVPNASQTSTASGWPLSSATPVIMDFNVDGYVDVEVKGVAAATGVLNDQIVYSPGVPLSSQPLGIRGVDGYLKKFVGNMLDYWVDPDYFWLYATAQIFYGTVQYFSCNWGFTSGAGVYDSYVGGFDSVNCDTYYIFVSGAYLDFSLYSGPAVSIWAHANDFEEGTETAAQSTEASQEEAEDVLQVQIGGWPMEEELGPTGEHTDPDQRRGLETFWAILGVAQKNAEEIDTEESPKQSPEPAQCITVNARHVGGMGPTSQHASVVHQPVPVVWISAFDSDESVTGNGVLISRPNWPSDNPRLTQIVSTVTNPPGISCTPYWGMLSLADDNYDDNLPYFPTPDLWPGTYNSNGYAHGILNATGGSAAAGIGDRLWGWGKPVPSSAFQ
jgi:hypothetical protein